MIVNTRKTTPGNGRFFVLPRFMLLFVLVSCSSADPEIMQTEAYVIAGWYPVDGTVEYRLHVAADVHDPDGAEDVELMRVELTRYRLTWERTVDRLRHSEGEGRHWYSIDDLALPTEKPIGTIRITIEDKSLREAEREVVIPPLDDVSDPALYPKMALNDDATGDGGDDVAAVERAGGTGVQDRYSSPTVVSPRIEVPRGVRKIYLVVIEADGRVGEPLEFPIEETAAVMGTEVAVPASFLERIEGRRFYLLVEHSRTLWLESGPWSLEQL